MPSRRNVLLLAAGAAGSLAGCLSTFAGPDTSPPADCPDEPRVPDLERHPDGEEPPAIPSPPDSLTEEAVVEYAEAYELAYVWRRHSGRGALLDFSFDGEAEAVWSDGDGVHVEFDVVFYSGDYRNEDGEEHHFDGGSYVGSYLVTGDAVWRAETDVDPHDPADPPGPREDGELLECF